jgi:hypothetical protein
MQSLPRSVERYGAAQRREIAAALASIRRSWRRMGLDFDSSWPLILPLITQALTTAQGRLLEDVPGYIPTALKDTGQRIPEQVFTPNLSRFVGVTGGGVALGVALSGTIPRTKGLISRGMPAQSAMLSTGNWLMRVAGTILSDTARGGEQLAMKSRSVGYYVRMLEPPSCGRCVILAGSRYSTSTAFQRHPGCDCRHVPVTDADAAEGLVASLPEYLDGASDEQLVRIFGSKANAQAYKDGADANQLINAYRKGSVYTAQVGGRSLLATTEGVTRRGWANSSMRQADYLKAQGESKPGRYRSLKAPRIMPATIYRIAANQAEADRLLRLYGWIF